MSGRGARGKGENHNIVGLHAHLACLRPACHVTYPSWSPSWSLLSAYPWHVWSLFAASLCQSLQG